MRSLGSIQIDQMQPFDAAILVAPGHIERILVVCRFSVIIALCEADTTAVDQVYGRNNGNHSLKKFCKMCSPTDALFSGWNWVPKKLPRRMAALKVSPYVVTAIVSALTVGANECT